MSEFAARGHLENNDSLWKFGTIFVGFWSRRSGVQGSPVTFLIIHYTGQIIVADLHATHQLVVTKTKHEQYFTQGSEFRTTLRTFGII